MRKGLEIALVLCDAERGSAVSFPELIGTLSPGDEVVLNVTAVVLGLGSGGRHFVVARLGPPAAAQALPGHLMKLRYTPLQIAYGGPEEPADPSYPVLAAAQELSGMPVVCLELHSQLAPAAAALRAAWAGARIAYVMTDGGALPYALSDSAARLRDEGIVDLGISTGHAFGGDFEASTLHQGLLLARHVAGADAAIVAIGPGMLGSGTTFGHSGVQQGEAVNATASLHGTPVLALRISEADPRTRHRGLSHHTRAVLERVALAPAAVALPPLAEAVEAEIRDALRACAGPGHRVLRADGSAGLELLARRGVLPQSMGRSLEDDPAFFAAAAAGGALAAALGQGLPTRTAWEEMES